MSAISATLRTYSVLRDGTLRVVVDVDPRFKAEFHQLFVDIDLPVAIAPLVPKLEQVEQTEKQKGGPLCTLAAIWCKDEDFRDWLGVDSEEEAAKFIRRTCGIESRSLLDHYEQAATRFNEHFRIPYKEYLEKANDL